MMIFGIKDEAAKSFVTYFHAPTAAVAIRNFETNAHDENSNIGRFPEDYALYQICRVDDETGEAAEDLLLLERASNLVSFEPTDKKPE